MTILILGEVRNELKISKISEISEIISNLFKGICVHSMLSGSEDELKMAIQMATLVIVDASNLEDWVSNSLLKWTPSEGGCLTASTGIFFVGDKIPNKIWQKLYDRGGSFTFLAKNSPKGIEKALYRADLLLGLQELVSIK